MGQKQEDARTKTKPIEYPTELRLQIICMSDPYKDNRDGDTGDDGNRITYSRSYGEGNDNETACSYRYNFRDENGNTCGALPVQVKRGKNFKLYIDEQSSDANYSILGIIITDYQGNTDVALLLQSLPFNINRPPQKTSSRFSIGMSHETSENAPVFHINNIADQKGRSGTEQTKYYSLTVIVLDTRSKGILFCDPQVKDDDV